MSAYTDSEGNVALMLTKAEAVALRRLLYYRVSGCPDGERAHLTAIRMMLPNDGKRPNATGEVVYQCEHPDHQWYVQAATRRAAGVSRG